MINAGDATPLRLSERGRAGSYENCCGLQVRGRVPLDFRLLNRQSLSHHGFGQIVGYIEGFTG